MVGQQNRAVNIASEANGLKEKKIYQKHLKMTQEERFLVARDVYLKSGIHIGTKFRTKFMEPFIYKTRPDGLSVLNLQKIDERIKIAADFLAQYDPKDILIICRRENGWKAVELFGELTGVRTFAGRYPPGILTNPNLEEYTEAKIVLVVDVWPDRNAVMDSVKVGIPVIALCDTNNQSNFIDFVLPCNNKGKKSLGLMFYILSKEFLKAKGKITKDEEMTKKVEEFIEE